MAYALRLEDLGRDVHALTISAGIAQAMGAEVSLPDWESSKAMFDLDLAAEPVEGDEAEENVSGRGIEKRVLRMV